MIHVSSQAEPYTFDNQVRIPGQAFLLRFPNPTSRDYSHHRADYWRSCLGELHKSYSEICSYMAEWILLRDSSVDHFVPKSADKSKVYEWTNYRLALKQLNQNKGQAAILDPFTITNGWFIIDFDTFFVKPEPSLDKARKADVRFAIQKLKLNNDMFRNRRIEHIRSYCNGRADIASLERRAPFIALELHRQNLLTAVCEKFRDFLARQSGGSVSGLT